MPENIYKRGGTYYARYKAGGKEFRRSLRTGSLAVARRRLDKFMQEIQAEIYDNEKTWQQATVEWRKTVNVRESVLKRYQVSLRQWSEFLRGMYLPKITRSFLAEKSAIRRKNGATTATVRRDLTAISNVMDVAMDLGWIDSNPAKDYASRLKERRDPIVLPLEVDIDRVVERAPETFRPMIRFAQYTGMRQEEIASLTYRQVRGEVIDLTKTKTGMPRSFRMDERARGTLEGTEKHPESAYVFWHGKGQRYQNVSSQFGRIARLAERDAEREGKPFHRFRFHDLRHWYAVDYLRRGNSIYDLQKILGHASIKTTEIYLSYLTPDQISGAQKGAHVERFDSDDNDDIGC